MCTDKGTAGPPPRVGSRGWDTTEDPSHKGTAASHPCQKGWEGGGSLEM